MKIKQVENISPSPEMLHLILQLKAKMAKIRRILGHVFIQQGIVHSEQR